MWSVGNNFDCNKCRQTSRLVAEAQIQTTCNFKKNEYNCDRFLDFVHRWCIYHDLESIYKHMVSTHSYSFLCSHYNLRLHKNLQCIVGTGNIGYLLSAVCYSSSFATSERDDFIHLPCSAIYGYLSVLELVIKPVTVLLEDQRSEASCKRNIKANVPLLELVYYAFPLYYLSVIIKIHSKIAVKLLQLHLIIL